MALTVRVKRQRISNNSMARSAVMMNTAMRHTIKCIQLLPHRVHRLGGGVMSGRRSLIKGYFWRCAGRGCGHVFGLT
jgi:hypothetical protein